MGVVVQRMSRQFTPTPPKEVRLSIFSVMLKNVGVVGSSDAFEILPDFIGRNHY